MPIKGKYTGKVDFSDLAAGMQFLSFMTPPPEFKLDPKHERISFIDPENIKNSIVLETNGLAVDKHGHITDGTVINAHFIVGGKEAVTVNGMHADAAKLEVAFEHGYPALYGYFNNALKGNVTEIGDKFDNLFEVGVGGQATVEGAAGNDSLAVWHKKDIIFDGGGGEDALIFNPLVGSTAAPKNGAEVDLTTGKGHNAFGGTLHISNVEDVTGTANADKLFGDNKANVLIGNLGDDILKGRGGDDTIAVGAAGVFSSGPDVSTKVSVDGGAGKDTVTYDVTNGEAVNVLDLTAHSKNTGLFANDTISNVEVFSFKTYFFSDAVVAVHFNGTGADETIQLATADADDVIEGGGGNDVISGSFGDNVFIFRDSFGSDTIMDFSLSSTNVIRFTTSVFLDFDDVMAHATQEGSDVLIDAGDGNALRLSSVSLGSLNEGNFDFV